MIARSHQFRKWKLIIYPLINRSVILPLLFGFAIIWCLVSSSPTPSNAQDNRITLTLNMVAGMEYLQDAHIFDLFEQENPDVRVHAT